VHPGGVATSIVENARVAKGVSAERMAQRRAAAKRALRLPPEVAGEIIVKGIERRAARVIVGTDAKVISLLERFAPVSYWKVLVRLLRSA